MAWEPTIYSPAAGYTNPGSSKTESLLIHTMADMIPIWRMSCLTATPGLRVLAAKAFGGKAALGAETYGNIGSLKSTGSGITFTDGGYLKEFVQNFTTISGSVIGQLGNVNPQFISPGVSGAYSWARLIWSVGIPDEVVNDQKGRAQIFSVMKTRLDIAKQSAIRDLSYLFFGHSSAPSGSPAGLNYLISVTQGSLGGINTTTYDGWKNCYTPVTSIGGGGELDRPLALLRKIQGFNIRVNSFAEAADTDPVIWATPGAYQYYLRAAYADGVANQGLRAGDLYDIGIDAITVEGRPMVYDSAVQVPIGATASTEAMYWSDLKTLGLDVKRDEFLKVEGPAGPSPKDKQRYWQFNILARVCPDVVARRHQGCLYNLPANTDVISSNG